MSQRPRAHSALQRTADIWRSRSHDELKELSHIKRFLECFAGDSVFRQKLSEHFYHPQALSEEYGFKIDPDQLRPLFDSTVARYRFEQSDDRWPLAKRWDAYISELLRCRDELVHVGDTGAVNPRFHMWRRRQIARLKSELGQGAAGIVHPIVAYELSRGCTVGCWFCGVSAEKFGGYLPFNEHNESLWRGILTRMVERFGEAAQTGFCYWATDPSDNPDYLKFMRVHHELTGVLPQTTTAAPLKNMTLTREVIGLFGTIGCILNRFSILSVGQLRRVHATFTPEELLGVELVLQNPDALSIKTTAGRAISDKPKVKTSEVVLHPDMVTLPTDKPSVGGTIACVSGFLVNIPEGRIRLISPTKASSQWKDGYRIYGEEQFQTAADFGRAIDSLIEKHMHQSLQGRDRMAFRRDLTFERMTSGFKIANDRTSVAFEGTNWVTTIGDSIECGRRTMAEVAAAACAKGADVFAVTQALNELFQGGLLDDDPVEGGIGRIPRAVEPTRHDPSR